MSADQEKEAVPQGEKESGPQLDPSPSSPPDEPEKKKKREYKEFGHDEAGATRESHAYPVSSHF